VALSRPCNEAQGLTNASAPRDAHHTHGTIPNRDAPPRGDAIATQLRLNPPIHPSPSTCAACWSECPPWSEAGLLARIHGWPHSCARASRSAVRRASASAWWQHAEQPPCPLSLLSFAACVWTTPRRAQQQNPGRPQTATIATSMKFHCARLGGGRGAIAPRVSRSRAVGPHPLCIQRGTRPCGGWMLPVWLPGIFKPGTVACGLATIRGITALADRLWRFGR